MTPPSPARIDGILATKAPLAVVFRRGPSDVVQQLLWHLDTDEVQPGQWIRAHVYTRRCDLSPDGKRLVGFFSNFSRKRMKEAARKYGLERDFDAEAWTAISRAPYFTADALWFQSDTYCGGGRWVSDKRVEINQPYNRHLVISPPKSMSVTRVSYMGPGEWDYVWHARLRDRKWKQLRTDEPDVAMAWEKTVPGGRLLYRSASLEDCGDETWTLFDQQGNAVREWTNEGEHPGFFDFDRRGRLVYGAAGCLYAWSHWPEEEPRLIADLNANAFENVVAPYRARG